MKQVPTRRHAVLLALAAGASGGALAQSSPYYAGGSIAFTRDSNVFRLSDAVADARVAAGVIKSKSDMISTATLFAGIDQPFGRQRVTANVSLRDSRFADNSSQNNLGYGARARLDWATIERLSGSVDIAGDQVRLADQNLADPLLLERVLVRTRDANATARIGVVTRLTAEASWSHHEQDYDSRSGSFNRFDYRSDTFGAAMRYAIGGELTLGAGIKLGTGRYPALDSDFKRRDLDLLADWRASGASAVSARLSFGKTSYDKSTSGDFSGATGSLAWVWTPTGKLRLTTRLARETGQNIAAVVQQSTGNNLGDAQSTRLSTVLTLSGEYALSAKVALTAALNHSRRSLADIAPLTVFGPFTPLRGRDSINALTFAARWTPLRSTQLACDLSLQQRSVSQPGRNVSGSALTAPYKSNSIGCSAQLILQ